MVAKIRLLVVDDDEEFLNSITPFLERRGFQVTTVSNGCFALVATRSAGFDVILLDLKMPGMDGDELMPEIRKSDPDMEFVVLTGYGSLRSAMDFSKLGAFDYLSKPCGVEKLAEVLRMAARRRQLRNDADDLISDWDDSLHLF